MKFFSLDFRRFDLCCVCWVGIILGWLLLLQLNLTRLCATNVGLPPTRFYSLDDIGSLSPGFHIGFDPIGRICAVQYDNFVVLNDNEWINLIEDGTLIDYTLSQVAFAGKDRGYFSSHGHWGKLQSNKAGFYYPVSISPVERPEWSLASEFENILPTDDGVYFYNWNGLVYLDENTGNQTIIRIDGLDEIFELDGKVYVSVFSNGLRELDLENQTLISVDSGRFHSEGLASVTKVDSNSILFSHQSHGFLVFDGKHIREWKTELSRLSSATFETFCYLKEGNLAVAVEGRGIYILSPSGEIISSLTSQEFIGVREIVTNEDGVFWYASDNGIGKVQYGSGVTIVDNRVGMHVAWAELTSYDGELLVSSSNVMYRSVTDAVTGSMTFLPFDDQPDALNFSITALGQNILIANSNGVFMKKPGGRFELAFEGIDVNRLVAINDNTCLVIGSEQISAVKLHDGKLVEFVDRIDGFGFPSVLHQIGDSVWIELGLNRVVRIALKDDRIASLLVDEFPWKEKLWINIGWIGDRVILTGRDNQRIYFNETTEQFCDAPDLDSLLELSPFGAFRTVEDRMGTIWVSHIKGVSAIRKVKGQYQFEPLATGVLKEPTPILRVIGDDLWIISKNSLHHLQTDTVDTFSEDVKPVLDHVFDARTGEVLRFGMDSSSLGTFDYERNHLRFRVFAGSYFGDFHKYRIDIKRGVSQWSIPDANSLFTVPNLREGKYQITITVVDSNLPVGKPLVLDFVVNPPWYRNGWAFVFYALLGFTFILLLSAVPVAFVRNRNKMLSRVVDERTMELQVAMNKLREEEKLTAVHEERSRIASEIHDSVQQGLSGLKLILDSTLKYDSLSEDVRRRLNKAKTILTFTHQEVKHAVWGMETPLLENGSLEIALQKVTSLVNSKRRHITVRSEGQTKPLPAQTNHHLLRITQESITNALRHGDAHNVEILLQYKENQMDLTITDDGCGFDVEEVTKSPHQLGLRGLLSRVERFKGDVKITSNLDKGTQILITVPLNKNESDAKPKIT